MKVVCKDDFHFIQFNGKNGKEVYKLVNSILSVIMILIVVVIYIMTEIIIFMAIAVTFG